MHHCTCQLSGIIHLIIGPMFSGKTTELFRLTKQNILAGKQVIVIKYAKDNRYDTATASTHDKYKMEALSALSIAQVYEAIAGYDVIGIDEGQFFTDIAKYAQILANSGKMVIISALNGDFCQQPFQTITALFPLAERVDKLSAVCKNCGHAASFTYRTNSCKERELIGGEEMYQAVCRHCYMRFTRSS